MKHRLIIAVLIIPAFAIVLVFLAPRSPQTPLSIRIAGITTNTSPGRTEVEWSAAVPRSRSHRPAVLFWSCHYEETKKASVQHSTILLSATENDLLSTPHIASNEDGILQWGVSQTLNPDNAYRVIGAYWEPNRFEAIISWGQRLPVLRRLLPRPKPTFATSEWFEVTMDMDSLGTKREESEA